MNALYLAVLHLQHASAEELYDVRIDVELPSDKRVTTYVRSRARYLEEVSAVRRATSLLAPTSPAIRAALDERRRRTSAQLAEIFGAELSQFPRAERAERKALLESLSDWSTWAFLREERGLTESAARAVLRRGMRDHLGL